MSHCPCSTPCPARFLKRRSLSALLSGLMTAALLCTAPTAQAQEDRALAAAPAGPVRYIIVKAQGQGVNAEEAEQEALRSAHRMAAKHYAGLGGAAALDGSPQGQRILATHSTPPMGLASVSTVVLVELRLRPLTEPPPRALALPVLQVAVDAAGQVQVESSRPSEILVALDSGGSAEPEILPGGSGAVYRLAPGKPMRQALPKTNAASLRVLACTGGLAVPAAPRSVDDAFAKARPGKSRPATMQGVLSECVEAETSLAGKAGLSKRSMRAKGSESPVNMTGAAGREGGAPSSKDMP